MVSKDINLSQISTEARNTKTMELDSLTSKEIIEIMNSEDNEVVKAVRQEIDKISLAVDLVVNAFKNGGRLIYIGAGTSGRLGVLDAVECVPTFGVPDDMVIGLIAGGEGAFVKAVEGAEDSKDLAVSDLKKINLSKKDVVVGIAASGRTPYVIGGIEYANGLGCNTVSITCNKGSEVSKFSKIAIEAQVGPEVLTGSTRLKAGTAQKMILNMISTVSMVNIGKVYKNLMVDVLQTNDKLRVRAQNIVMEVTGVERDFAKQKLEECNNSAKTAIVSILLNCDAQTAQNRLLKSGGKVRNAVN